MHRSCCQQRWAGLEASGKAEETVSGGSVAGRHVSHRRALKKVRV